MSNELFLLIAPRARRFGTLRLFASALLATIATLGSAHAGAAVLPPVLPMGGQFAAGAGTITSMSSSTTSAMQINQTTTRAVINWQNFSIGQGGTVSISNGIGATLNRVVTSGNPSNIAGSLNATGSVYIVNQSGIVVAPGGRVVTGGDFVASTRDIPNSSFMSGGPMTAAGSSSGTIDNQGSITSNNGNVTLVGKMVTNEGQISAPSGGANLVAGDNVLLQPSDSGLQIEVNSGSGDVNNNGGTIAAAQAQLNAVGGNVYSLAVNGGGIIHATGTAAKGGHVYLTAGGDITVSTPIQATGDVTIAGAGHGGVSTGSAYGVEIANVITAGGPISITGSGGDASGGENYGVYINGGAVEATGAAPITISGTGGGAGGNSFGNDGVFIGGSVFGGGGPISIIGTGGASIGPDNFGITNEGWINNTGNGNITLTGISGANGAGAESPSSIGVGQIGVANLGFITAGTGNISISGTVGANATGAANFGVGIGAGVISTGGNGKIEISGTSNGAGGANAGVLILNYLADFGIAPEALSPVLTTADGQIRITGANKPADAAGNDSGVTILEGTIATSGVGDVRVTGNGGGASGSTGVVIGDGIAGSVGISSGHDLTIKSHDGDIVLNPGAMLGAAGKGDALVIQTQHGDFINLADPGALNTPNGKVRIHTDDTPNGGDGDSELDD